MICISEFTFFDIFHHPRVLISTNNLIFMFESSQITVSKTGVSKLAILALAIVFAAGLFVVGFDQGHVFSLVYGEQAYTDLYIHELTHDMRHAAGFPCH